MGSYKVCGAILHSFEAKIRGVVHETRCPKAIHGHRYPCPTSDFSFFVIFCVSRAAAPEGTGGDGVLTSIF